MVSLLLDHGASPDSRDTSGNLPVHLAAANADIAVLELLVRGARDLGVENDDGESPAEIAFGTGRVDLFGVLKVARKPGPGSRGSAGELNLPLFDAVKRNSPQAVNVLLEKNGADVNARNADGFQAIHDAAEGGHPELIALLISKGASVTDRENRGQWSPLHFAAANGHLEGARILVEAGADPRGLDSRHWTAADAAAFNGLDEMVRLLGDSGADLDRKNPDGQSPLDVLSASHRALGANPDTSG